MSSAPTSNGPIGKGEAPNLSQGNAILTTIDQDGKEIQNYLWIDAFNSDLNMQINISQLKKGLTYRPVRLQERILTFNTIWNVKDRPQYIKLLDNIRNHWAANLNENIPTPNKLTYFGANKTWIGFILNGSQTHAITDVILRYTFNMKLITKQNEGQTDVTGLAPFMPTADDITNFGSEWMTKSELESEINTTFDNLDTSAITTNNGPGGPIGHLQFPNWNKDLI